MRAVAGPGNRGGLSGLADELARPRQERPGPTQDAPAQEREPSAAVPVDPSKLLSRESTFEPNLTVPVSEHGQPWPTFGVQRGVDDAARAAELVAGGALLPRFTNPRATLLAVPVWQLNDHRSPVELVTERSDGSLAFHLTQTEHAALDP